MHNNDVKIRGIYHEENKTIESHKQVMKNDDEQFAQQLNQMKCF